MRPAAAGDAALLWRWRQDPLVRRWAFDSEVPTCAEHEAWFRRRLASPASRIWILECDGVPVGQVRYDRADDDAELDYSIEASFRGQGLSRALLGGSASLACRELRVARLVGIVRLANSASRHAFARAGFRQAALVVRRGEPCLSFEWTCRGRSD